MTLIRTVLRPMRLLSQLVPPCLMVASLGAAAMAADEKEVSPRPGANEVFLSEDLDVARYAKIFEGESREVYAERTAILDALQIAPGMAVADIGAGTGAFLPELDVRVGPEGSVYAVDISPKFLEHLRQRVHSEKLTRVEVVRGSEVSVALREASVDVAFVCDTYHHFEYPRSTLSSLFAAIRPGGSLVIVDFERIPGQSRKWVLEHVRAGKDGFRKEIESAGFRFSAEVPIEGLEENYLLRFERP